MTINSNMLFYFNEEDLSSDTANISACHEALSNPFRPPITKAIRIKIAYLYWMLEKILHLSLKKILLVHSGILKHIWNKALGLSEQLNTTVIV